MVLNYLLLLFISMTVSSFKTRTNGRPTAFVKQSFFSTATGINRRTSSRLYETYATGTSLSIEPTVYQEDLYGVLGVSMNASKVQLRDAYWAIAFRTHPDRNDTPEALSDFRNASHAYKVLGRSEQTRSDYDSKYRTKLYIESMDQLSRDVIAPFAMDIAIPLIDLTVRGIGSFALPFFQDAYEQSSSVFRAAFQSDESLDDKDTDYTGFEAITRAANAAMRTGLEQRIRRTKDSIGNTLDRLNSTAIQLVEAIDKEKELFETLEELATFERNSKIELQNIARRTQESKEKMAECVLTLGSSEEQSLRASVTITVLMETAGLLSDTKLREEEDINRLETALNLAKEKNRNTIMKKNALDVDIAAAVKTVEVLQEDLKAATNQKASLLSSLQQIEIDSTQLSEKTLKSAQEKIVKDVEMERQTFLRASLERRNTQLEVKRKALENTLAILEKDRAAKDSEAFLERMRILQKKKETEDKALASQKLLAEYAEIANMESSIRSREREVELMEQERNRLIKQVALEREKAGKGDIPDIESESKDITRSNSELNESQSTSTDSTIPNQKVNPFSAKEKYNDKAVTPTTTSQKFTTSTQKEAPTWRSTRDTSDFLNYNNFYF